MYSDSHTCNPACLLSQVDVETSLPSHLGRLQLRFDWPRAVSSGKQLMYVTQILVDSDTEPRCRPDNIINPLNLIVTTETHSPSDK